MRAIQVFEGDGIDRVLKLAPKERWGIRAFCSTGDASEGWYWLGPNLEPVDCIREAGYGPRDVLTLKVGMLDPQFKTYMPLPLAKQWYIRVNQRFYTGGCPLVGRLRCAMMFPAQCMAIAFVANRKEFFCARRRQHTVLYATNHAIDSDTYVAIPESWRPL